MLMFYIIDSVLRRVPLDFNWELYIENKDTYDNSYNPPKGEGYQMWTKLSNPHRPVSPVFSSLQELSIWAAVNYGIYNAKRWEEFLEPTTKVISNNG